MIDCVVQALNMQDTLDEHVVTVNFDLKESQPSRVRT